MRWRDTPGIVLGCLLFGCGENAPSIPEELLSALDGGVSVNSNQVQDLCFDGWLDPRAVDYDVAAIDEGQVCLANFFDDSDARLVLVNTAAIWCVACQQEWGGSGDRPPLEEEARSRFDRGLRVFGVLFQDRDEQPATLRDASVWTRTYEIGVPFAVDPDFKMGLYADPIVQPYNMVIDTRTREIVTEVNGDQPAILFSTIDRELDARSP